MKHTGQYAYSLDVSLCRNRRSLKTMAYVISEMYNIVNY